MKKTLHILGLLFISLNLFAQAPQKMSYQAVIRNAQNELVANKPVKIRISILQGSAIGTVVYSELHNATTNANGLATIEIGTGTSATGTFSSIEWGNGTYFLKTETDPNNGTNYTITGTSQLLSVPYALESKKAEIAGNGIKSLSSTGDTLTLSNGDKYIIPGIKKIDNPPSTINNGLVGFWPFNGNANDESGNGNNGTVSGAILTSDRFGIANRSYLFDGASKIIVPHSNSLLVGNEMTINLWYKQNTMGSTINYILQKGSGGGCENTGYYCGVDFNFGSIPNGIKGLIYGQSVSSCGNISSDTLLNSSWHMMTIVYQPGIKNNIYFDGKITVGNYSSCSDCIINNSLTPLIIGGFFNASTIATPKNWNGLLDDLRIYNRALTQEEITWLANN